MSGYTILIARAIRSCPPGNGLTEANTYSLDYELATAAAKDGAANVCSATLARTDNLNPTRGLPSGCITGITDTVTPGNTQSLAYSAANRLNSASGAYGAYTWTYDGVGVRGRVPDRPTLPSLIKPGKWFSRIRLSGALHFKACAATMRLWQVNPPIFSGV